MVSMKATRLVLIAVLFAFFGCEKAGRTDKEGAEVEMNLHVYQEIKACGEDWWLINRVFPAFIGFDESDAAFWEQRWNITIDTAEELRLYNLNNEGDTSGVLYTYSYSEGCNQWQPLDKDLYVPYTYDKAYVFYFHIPGKWIGDFPFRLRFENADTGEVKYSKEYVFTTTLCTCNEQNSEHLFVVIK